MTDDERRALIAAQADDVRQQLDGATLYWQPVDPDNPDEVLLAAYFAGQAAEARKRRKFTHDL
jgi:hypothetical protein